MSGARDAARVMSNLVEKACEKFEHTVSSMQVDSMDPLTIKVEVSGGMETRGWFSSQQHSAVEIVGHYLEVISGEGWEIEHLEFTVADESGDKIEIKFTARR
jgi:hypothetical protein